MEIKLLVIEIQMILNELVNKSYVDQNLSKYLPIDGSLAMRGELSLGSNPLTDLHEPKYSNDATTKNYVDNALTEGCPIHTN